MRLRTKLEKLEKELKASEGEVKIVIKHVMIGEDGKPEEFRTQEIALKHSAFGTEIAKGGKPS